MGDLSTHFDRKELACRHCGQLHLDPALLPALEQLRSLAGAPVEIHDAYRCPVHNAEVGGVPNSQHCLGLAADLSISGLSYRDMFLLAMRIERFRDGGIGVYDTSPRLHVDVRQGPARWAVKGANEHQLPLHELIDDATLHQAESQILYEE